MQIIGACKLHRSDSLWSDCTTTCSSRIRRGNRSSATTTEAGKHDQDTRNNLLLSYLHTSWAHIVTNPVVSLLREIRAIMTAHRNGDLATAAIWESDVWRSSSVR